MVADIHKRGIGRLCRQTAKQHAYYHILEISVNRVSTIVDPVRQVINERLSRYDA